MKNKLKLALGLSASMLMTSMGFADDSNSITVRTVGSEVTPYHYTGSLLDLPLAQSWRAGDGIKEVPRKNYAATDPQDKDYKMSQDPLSQLQQLTTPNANRAFGDTIINMDGQGFTGVNPPDTTGAIGKNYYIQSINGSGGSVFTVYNKTTGAVEAGPIAMESLAPSGPCTSGSGDPIILYDETAERWFMQEFVSGANALCFYISTTDDPINGGWNFYQFTGATFPDYPHFGVWSDAYYGTANENPATVYAFDRTNMLAGTTARAAQAISLGDLPGYGFQTATPADWDGEEAPPMSAPGIIMRHIDEEAHSNFTNNPATDLLEMWEFVVDFDDANNSSFTKVANDIVITDFNSYFLNYSVFDSVPQPGSGSLLDPIREVILNRLQYRNFGTHEVILGVLPTNLDPATTGSNVNASLRWFELRRVGGIASPWTLYQEGTYDPNTSGTENRLVGSVSMDKAGNIAMAYTKTNTDASDPLSASIAYTGRLDGDATDVMTQAEVVIKAGTGANSSGRWGDYASMDVDPTDDCTFWFTGEYQNGANWGTSISSFVFEGCDGPGFKISSDPAQINVCALDMGVSSTLSVEAFNAYDQNVNLSFTAVPSIVSNQMFATNPVTAPGNSVISFDVLGGEATGSYVLTVEGIGSEQPPEMGMLTKSTDITLLYSAGMTTAVNLTAPIDGASNVSLSTPFSWDADANATGYRLLVSDDMAFSNILIDQVLATNSYSASNLPDATIIYWKVSTQSSCNGADVESSVFSFSTTALPGSCAIGFQPIETVAYDFESGAQEWTHSGLDGTIDQWALSGANPNSGTQAFHGNETSNGNSILTSPEITLPTGQAPLTLQFWNAQSMEDRGEDCFDGGILEISTDGGSTFDQVPGSAMFSDPYDGTLAAANSLGAVEAWCGDPQAYINSIVDIDSYAGQTVQFRFHKGNDGSVNQNGWDIDDVKVIGCEETIPRYTLEADTTSFEVCANDTGLSSILTATEALGFNNPVTLSALSAPLFIDNIVYSNNPIDLTTSPGQSTLTFGAGGTPLATGEYTLTIQGVADKELPEMGTITRMVDLEISYSAGMTTATNLTAPANEAMNVPTTVTFTWDADANATSYHLMVSGDVDFSNLIVDQVVASNSYDAVNLPSSVELYWKVSTGSICNGSPVESAVSTFITEALIGDCPFGVANVSVASYDFESGDQGWTHSGIGSDDGWDLSMVNPHSGLQAFHGIEANNANTVLVSPAIDIPLGLSQLSLSFWNRQSMEDRTDACYDGGFLEVSTDGGMTYNAIPGSALLTDPYDGPINAGANPLDGNQAWCGDPQEYLNSIVDIASYAGQTVQFRFHKGNDGSVNKDGWDIDDVKIYGCQLPNEIFENGFEQNNP